MSRSFDVDLKYDNNFRINVYMVIYELYVVFCGNPVYMFWYLFSINYLTRIVIKTVDFLFHTT